MQTLCDFTIHPVSAPLGEEVTKHENFKNAYCKMFILFPSLSAVQTAGVDFNPLRDPEMENQSKFIWNPEKNSLIHHIHMNIPNSEMNMENWDWKGPPATLDIAREVYLLYKKIFVAFVCDEAEGIDAYLNVTFHWKKEASKQIVIYPLEDNREMTKEEWETRSWYGPRESCLVFSHSSDG